MPWSRLLEECDLEHGMTAWKEKSGHLRESGTWSWQEKMTDEDRRDSQVMKTENLDAGRE